MRIKSNGDKKKKIIEQIELFNYLEITEKEIKKFKKCSKN